MAEPRRKTVLVIDDQEDERAIQRAILGHIGYHVNEASNGADGLDAAQASPPDLILLDVAMPLMDGFEVCRTLRADPRTQRIPVVIFTASAVDDLDGEARAAGANAVIVKPADPRAVMAEVRRLIGPPTE
jgi:CheY-like chemotaxis protein